MHEEEVDGEELRGACSQEETGGRDRKERACAVVVLVGMVRRTSVEEAR